MNNDQTALEQYMLRNPNMSKPVELLPVLEMLHELVETKDFAVIDEILTGMSYNLKMLSPTAMVCLARYTFIIREHLNEWKNYVSAIHDRLSEMDLDAARILRGLI